MSRHMRQLGDILANCEAFSACENADGTWHILASCYTGTGYVFADGIAERSVAEWMCGLLMDDVALLRERWRRFNERVAVLERAQ